VSVLETAGADAVYALFEGQSQSICEHLGKVEHKSTHSHRFFASLFFGEQRASFIFRS
jgi:hypothetical protein